MPGNYNRVVLVGNLTRDPELRYVASGMGVAKFTIAVNRRTKTGDETTFIDIVAWDKLAETCNSYLKKGMSALVEGRLVIRSYDDKDGVKRKATEVVIDQMQMLDRKGGDSGGSFNENAGAASSSNNRSYSAPVGAGAGSFDDSAIEDEIPF
jgi:single-strand DNA-binding protein